MRFALHTFILDNLAFARSRASLRNVAGLNDELSTVALTAATRFDGHTCSTTASWTNESGKQENGSYLSEKLQVSRYRKHCT